MRCLPDFVERICQSLAARQTLSAEKTGWTAVAMSFRFSIVSKECSENQGETPPAWAFQPLKTVFQTGLPFRVHWWFTDGIRKSVLFCSFESSNLDLFILFGLRFEKNQLCHPATQLLAGHKLPISVGTDDHVASCGPLDFHASHGTLTAHCFP